MIKAFVVILSGSIFLSGCGSSPQKEDRQPTKPVSEVRLVGRVQRVNKASRFVLIRRYGFWRVGDGETVESRGDGRTANLLPSGEKLGEHIAADIRSGSVEVGDAVYIRKIRQGEVLEREKNAGEEGELKKNLRLGN